MASPAARCSCTRWRDAVPVIHRLEPSLAAARSGDRFQFERQGYFCIDPDTAPARLVVNRTVGLRDTWAKIDKS